MGSSEPGNLAIELGIPAPPPRTTYQDPRPAATVPWSTGLCGCFPNHFLHFCISCCCPFYTFGQVSDIIDHGSPSCATNGAIYILLAATTGHARCYSMMYRMKMRRQYALEGSGCQDCVFHCFCEPCALTQEYRELQSRGFEMPLGWVDNAERQDRRVGMAPVVQPGMQR